MTETNQQVSKSIQDSETKEDSIFTEQIVNRVIVSVKPVSFYIDRAKRALRLHEEVTIMGFGNHMSAACTIVETLKRQKIAKIHKIETTMDTPLLNTNNNVTFARPLPKIIIHLRRGEFGHFISGYYQRKVIEIFESLDKDSNGRLSAEQVNGLNFPSAFHATDESRQLATKEIHGKSQISLPEFIRFASYCIHPKLRDNVFQQIVEQRYGVRSSSQQDDVKHDDDDIHEDIQANNHPNDKVTSSGNQ